MRHVAFIVLITLFFGCKKENKEPECRFTNIAIAGKKHTVTYRGDSLVTVGDDNYTGYKLFFNPQGRLIRNDEPLLHPHQRTELKYNGSGQVTEIQLYSNSAYGYYKYYGKIVFTYSNGKITNLREENLYSQVGNLYDHEVIWDDNNIKSVVNRLNGQPYCATHFNYDGSIPNRMRHFTDFYFGAGYDNFTSNLDYNYYLLPFYFSEMMPVKQESDCFLSETKFFQYTFLSSGLLESMSSNGNILWQYEYECR